MIKPDHKHLLINATINKFPNENEEDIVEDFMTSLVEDIDMKVAKGPISSWVSDLGNVGWTSAILLKTSHASMHIWNEWGLLQADLYSCKEFDKSLVINKIKNTFDATKIKYRLLDRNGGINDEEGLKIQEW